MVTPFLDYPCASCGSAKVTSTPIPAGSVRNSCACWGFVHDFDLMGDAGGVETRTDRFEIVAVEREVVEYAGRLHDGATIGRYRQMQYIAITRA